MQKLRILFQFLFPVPLRPDLDYLLEKQQKGQMLKTGAGMRMDPIKMRGISDLLHPRPILLATKSFPGVGGL